MDTASYTTSYTTHVLPDYAELFCMSNFSFLQGASHAEELVARAPCRKLKLLMQKSSA